MPFPSDDRFLRFTLADTKRAAGFLREFLPSALLVNLDLDRIKRIHDQAITANLNEIRDDLNLECSLLSGGKVLVRILVEHKSYHDPHLWLQLMKSITTMWEQIGMAPVIPVVVHTGSSAFQFEEPHTKFRNLGQAICDMFPKLSIVPVDLATLPENLIWKSENLDHVAKVALSILRLSQQENLDVANLRKLLRTEWPNCTAYRQRRYIIAAINYLRLKNPVTAQAISEIGVDMRFAHPINPNSSFAQELREEFAKGESVGIEQGLERGQALMKIEIVEGMLAKGLDWKLIQEITHLDQAAFDALKKQLKG